MLKAQRLGLTITVLLIVVGGYSSFFRNCARLRDLKRLFACVGANDTETLFPAMWAGVEHARLNCPQGDVMDAGEDMVAVASWLSGHQVLPDRLSGIDPAWRRRIFVWRNGEEILSADRSVGVVSAPTLFLAQLAVWTWHHDALERSLQLIELALAAQPSEKVAEILIRGIGGPRSRAEITRIAQLRRQIAQALPGYTFNYADWFEMMVANQEWQSAEQACQGLRRNVQPPFEGAAATCRARLAFYGGDYVMAYTDLLSASASLPQDGIVLTWLGLSAKQLGRYAEAEQVLYEAIHHTRSGPALLGLYWNLGDCQRALGKIEQARQSYQTAIRYAPDERSRRYHQNLLDQVQ